MKGQRASILPRLALLLIMQTKWSSALEVAMGGSHHPPCSPLAGAPPQRKTPHWFCRGVWFLSITVSFDMSFLFSFFFLKRFRFSIEYSLCLWWPTEWLSRSKWLSRTTSWNRPMFLIWMKGCCRTRLQVFWHFFGNEGPVVPRTELACACMNLFSIDNASGVGVTWATDYLTLFSWLSNSIPQLTGFQRGTLLLFQSTHGGTASTRLNRVTLYRHYKTVWTTTKKK